MFLKILRFILIIIHCLLAFSFGIFLCLMRPFNPSNIYIVGRYLSKFGLKILGIRFIVRGRENLVHNKACVIISNHQNNIDMFVGSGIFPKRTVTLGKKSIKWIPFFGQFYWLSGNIFIDRKNKKKAKASMKKVTHEIVHNQVSVWILPEGTRSKGRGLLPFKRGAFLTAIDAQVDIIPVCYSNYHKKFNWSKLDSGTILAEILAPIETKGLSSCDSHQLALKCHKLMKAKIELLDRELASC